ncbi:hypothetical protein [Pedobacter aquatilis]|nr:hypothetical protein [Pedobacter aquatilis]
MLNNCADELVHAEYIQPPEVLSGQLMQYKELNSIANCLLENFLQS